MLINGHRSKSSQYNELGTCSNLATADVKLDFLIWCPCLGVCPYAHILQGLCERDLDHRPSWILFGQLILELSGSRNSSAVPIFPFSSSIILDSPKASCQLFSMILPLDSKSSIMVTMTQRSGETCIVSLYDVCRALRPSLQSMISSKYNHNTSA